MKRLLTILFFAFLGQQLFAYPITPQTLRKLISRSQYIVIALIDNPEKGGEKFFDPKTNDTLECFSFGGDGIADLYIKEILKGKPSNSNQIQVTYEAGMICPAPAHYPDKKMVIAFLAKDDTSKTYLTVGLSYGSKIMDSETEMNYFKTRILEYLEILKIKNKRKRKSSTVEWLVKCAENKYTRWEGAYELSRKGDFMSYYDRSKDEQFYKKLTKTQLYRLDTAFFATDTIGDNEMLLANLITSNNYPKLKDCLLKSLKFSDYFISKDIMQKVIEIAPNIELKRIYDELDRLDYFDKDREERQKQLNDKFILTANRQ